MILCRWPVLALIPVLVKCGSVQPPDLQLPAGAAANQQTVVKLFSDSYEAYQKYAWGHDELLPVSESYYDPLNGWGTTIVDALDTMWLMGLYEWFGEAVNQIETVDYSLSQTNSTANLLETTIHHVGGLLSAYELSGRQYEVLVQKAEQVTRQMAYAWIENNSIPYNNINFTNHVPTFEVTAIAAATLTMEWNRLSLYTNNDTYRQLAEKAVQHMIHMPTTLPGMPAMVIDPSTGNSIGSLVTWGGTSDTFYEYLIKYPRLTNTDDTSYADMWATAVDTSIKVLLKTSTVGNWTYLADYDGQIRHVGSHLACFSGGNWILGGKLLNNDTIFNIGLQLTDACWNTYESTATGIGPEAFAYISSDGNYTGGDASTSEQIQFYNKHGYYITSPYYFVRPEVLESNFYAWRATGDTKYIDRATSAIQSFQRYLPTTVAYAGLNDVNNVASTKFNETPSYWFAGVLKYLYLTFDDPDNISLDDYVFNTEAHPFNAPEAKSTYGSVGY